jgi:hypothetical protein
MSKVIIPKSLTSIGDSAFSLGLKLTEITLQNSVTSIGRRAFYGCSALLKINFNGTSVQWNAITKGEEWYYTNGANGNPNLVVVCENGKIYYTSK